MAYRPIYYDLETTGIRFDKDRIIEIGAFDPVNDKTFCFLVNPGTPIPKEATDIHHITDEMVRDADSFEKVAKDFVQFCSGEVVLIAHNNDSFDKLFLEEEFKKAKMEIPSWPYIDSLKWARKYRRDLPRHSLQYLREIYGIPANQAHRALDDVFVLHQVFSEMIDDLSMEIILGLMNPKTEDVRMPFGKHQGKLLKEVPGSYFAWLKKNGAFEKEENKHLFESLKKLGILEESLT